MTSMKDSIDWIGAKEAEMREYEEGLRLVKKFSQSDEISYIMNNLNSKPLNELRRYIGMKEVEPNHMLNADWFRDKLGISQGLADRFEGYCNPDEASKAIREYREKNGLSDDIPLSQEIRDLLNSNNLLLNEIMDSMREGKVTERVLQVYKLEDGLYGISLFTLYSSLTPMKTYDSEQLGIGDLDAVVDIMIEYAHEIPISQMIVKREIGRELNAVVMQRALKMMEEEERKRGEYL